MALFKKETDFLDLTLLQKRGLLKIKEEPGQNIENEYADLTPPTASVEPSAPSFDFLDSLAGTSNPPSLQAPHSENSSADIQHLNVKLEDLEYKLERFLERIEKLELKLNSK